MSDQTDRLQAIQDELGRMRNRFRDSERSYWALQLAWEAVRLAWYELHQGNDGGKLDQVQQALDDYRHKSGRKA